MHQLRIGSETKGVFLSFLSTVEENLDQWPNTTLQIMRGRWCLRIERGMLRDETAHGAVALHYEGALYFRLSTENEEKGIDEAVIVFLSCHPTPLGAVRALQGYLQSCPFQE